MKIVKVGSFDCNGIPTGWHFDLSGFENCLAVSNAKDPAKLYCLGLDMIRPGSVDVNGVEIEEWTLNRKLAKDEK